MTDRMPTEADVAAVRMVLAAIGIPASEEEITSGANDYPAIKGFIGLLHTVSAARYEPPGLHFDPTPRFVKWG